MVGNKWGFYDKGVKFRLTLCIFPKNNAFSIIMFRWPLSWCCHSSSFSFNEYNKQEWTSAICSCCHCLWTARCFRGVCFSFKSLSNNVQESEKKKKLVRFCQLSPFPDVFGMRNAVGQLKKKLHFQKYLGSKTPVKSQGSESAQKFVSSGVQSLSWMQIPEWEGIEVMKCRFFSQIQIRRKPWPDNRLVWEKSLKLF